MNYRVFAITLCAIALLLPFTSVEARHYYHYGNPGYYHAQPHVIYWGKSKFYKHQNGLIYARQYSQRTIIDLVSLCRHHRMRYFYVLPDGYEGAIPHHLKRFAFHKFSRAGITMRYYQPRRYQPYRYHYNHQPGFSFSFRF